MFRNCSTRRGLGFRTTSKNCCSPIVRLDSYKHDVKTERHNNREQQGLGAWGAGQQGFNAILATANVQHTKQDNDTLRHK